MSRLANAKNDSISTNKIPMNKFTNLDLDRGSQMKKFFLIVLLAFLNLSITQTERWDEENYQEDSAYPFAISDDEILKNAILKNRMSLSKWLRNVDDQHIDFFCFGEVHSESYRFFLAEEVFPFLSFHTLFLEAEPAKVGKMVQEAQNGSQHVEMHLVDITSVIQIALSKNPPVKIVGVDQTEEQIRKMQVVHAKVGREFISRDGDIALNILDNYTTGKRHVALYGANHCAHYNIGLGDSVPFYHHLSKVFREENITSRNILLVQNNSGEFLDAYFQRLGFKGETFVIPDTSKIDSADYNFQWTLKEIFNNYETIIYFVQSPT